MATGDAANAEAAFRQCVRLWPSYSPFHEALGNALALAGQKDEAERELRLASDLEPKRAEAHLKLCYFYAFSTTDRGRDALAEFGRVQELDTDLAKSALAGGPLKERLAEIAQACGIPAPTV
jgi:Flp pilus assembly protein TadD